MAKLTCEVKEAIRKAVEKEIAAQVKSSQGVWILFGVALAAIVVSASFVLGSL